MIYFTGEKHAANKKSWLCSNSTREAEGNDDGFVLWNLQDREIGFSQLSKTESVKVESSLWSVETRISTELLN